MRWGSFGPMVFSRTEQEAKHLGKFLSEMLTQLNSWAKDEDVYKRECDNFPGFKNVGTAKGKEDEAITFTRYQQCVRSWHKILSEAFGTCLGSNEGVEVHNALTILSGLVPGAFPIHDVFHKETKDKVVRRLTCRAALPAVPPPPPPALHSTGFLCARALVARVRSRPAPLRLASSRLFLLTGPCARAHAFSWPGRAHDGRLEAQVRQLHHRDG